MPLDWQFATVTLIASGALWVLVRPLLRRKGRGASGQSSVSHKPCASCASNAASPAADRTRTSTVQVVSLNDLRTRH